MTDELAGGLEDSTEECAECVGRGWQGGALRTRDADGVSGTDVNAYKIPCPDCGGTGKRKRLRLNSQLSMRS
jgi:hypothetical protein